MDPDPLKTNPDPQHCFVLSTILPDLILVLYQGEHGVQEEGGILHHQLLLSSLNLNKNKNGFKFLSIKSELPVYNRHMAKKALGSVEDGWVKYLVAVWNLALLQEY